MATLQGLVQKLKKIKDSAVGNFTGNVKALGNSQTRGDLISGLGFTGVKSGIDTINKITPLPRRLNSFNTANTVTNIARPVVSNTISTVKSGADDLWKGSQSFGAFNPTTGKKNSTLTRVKGFAQGAKGIANIAAPIRPDFQIANITANVNKPLDKNDYVRRIATGFLKGQTDKELKSKSSNKLTKTPIGNMDLAEGLGNLVGITRNPLNQKVFNASEKISIPINFLKKANANKIASYITTNSARGAVEDVFLSLDKIPENASSKEKAKFILQNALTGAVAETAVRGGADLSGLSISKLAQTFDLLRGSRSKSRLKPGFTNSTNQKNVQVISSQDQKYVRDIAGRFAKRGASEQRARQLAQQVLAKKPNLTKMSQEEATMVLELRRQRTSGGNTLQEVPGVKFGTAWKSEPNQAVMGGVAGFEPELDEDGKPTGKIKYSPEKGLAGMAVMGGIKKIKSNNVPDFVEYPVPRSQLTGKQLDLTNEQLRKNTLESFGKDPLIDPIKEPEFISPDESSYQAGMAYEGELVAKDKFDKIFSRWVGKRDSAQTTGTQKAISFLNVPKAKTRELLDVIEGVTSTNDKEVIKYATDIKAQFDNLYKDAKQAGVDFGYLKNYITHIWKEPPEVVEQAFRSAKGKFKFSNDRTVPTYSEGINLGLTPKYDNVSQIMEEYATRLERSKANVELLRDLKSEGLVVPASVARQNPGFSPIEAPGIGDNATQTLNGTFIGKWYAPSQIAQQLNKVFSPETESQLGGILDKTANISGKVQDITLSGGLPGTPVNAFSFAQGLKEITAGRIKSPLQAVVRSLSPKASQEFFKRNIGQIKKMQENNIPVRTNFTIEDLLGKEAEKSLGKIWTNTMNDPTFKRFLPQLQIQMFNDIEAQALKSGNSPDEAVVVASKAVKNFYGTIGSDQAIKRNKIANDAKSTFLFAPQYRESMINFWVNNIKALKNPMALENRNNVKFLVGATLTYGAMDALNQQFNGRHMHENPDNKKDKLLIPIGNGKDDVVIGIPFLSSIATIPRGIYRQGSMVLEGDIKGALTDAYQSYASMAIKPAGDVIANQDYFGNEIYDETASGTDKLKAGALYAGKALMHPYAREALSVAANKLPISDENKKKLGIKSKPLYQTVSQAFEAPLRFYTNKSVNANYYFDAQKRALKGLPKEKQDVYNQVFGDAKAVPKTTVEAKQIKMAQAQLQLNNPDIIEARKKALIEKSKITGEPLDPFYTLTPEQQKVILNRASQAPGSEISDSLTKIHIDWLKPYWKSQDVYYTKLKESGVFDEKDRNTLPGPKLEVADEIFELQDKYFSLPSGNGLRTRFLEANPALKMYWDEKAEYENEMRVAMGLPEMESNSWGSGKKKIKVKGSVTKAPSSRSNPVKLQLSQGSKVLPKVKIQMPDKAPKFNKGELIRFSNKKPRKASFKKIKITKS